jgi:zinc transporter, ZIP family
MSHASLLLWTLAAVLAAGAGALLGSWRWFAEHAVGWATSAAAGLMLGIGYVLLGSGRAIAPGPTLLGALLGLAAARLSDTAPGGRGEHTVTVLARVSSPPAADLGAILASALHSAFEGVAIGAAAGVGAPVARFLIVSFAAHNISEGAVLGALLAGRGWTRGPAAGMALLARTSQPVVALAVAFLLAAAPNLLPWLTGAAFGSLLYLIVAELLPQSYRQAGRTAIALVVSLAAGMVALMGAP